MSFGFVNDSTRDFQSPYAETVTFLFRDTTPQDLDTTMRSLGACPKAKLGHGWLFPRSGQPLLDFNLIEDVVDYAIDLVWESWKFYTPLLEALSVKEENALIVRVAVRDEAFLEIPGQCANRPIRVGGAGVSGHNRNAETPSSREARVRRLGPTVT